MSTNIKLPKDWKAVLSSEIMDIRDGTHDTPRYVTQNGIPLITSKNLKENKIDFEKVSFISLEDHLEISKRSKVEEGDILFAMIGTIGNPAIIKGDANFSIKNVGLFKKNESVILPEFFVNFLRSSFFEKQLNERKLLKGTTQKFIPLGNLRNIEIPLPTLSTQQAIVSKIEELFSELDNGIANLKTAQQQLKTYRQSVLKWAFEGKLTNKNVKEGELPKGWKTQTLKELSYLITKGASPKWQGINYTEDSSQVLFITSENVRENYIDISKPKYLEEFFNEKQKRSILKNGDILINIVGASIGRAAIYNLNFNANINQAVSIVRLKPEVDNRFISYFLNSNKAFSYYNLNKVDVARANLSLVDIGNIELTIPQYEKQIMVVQEIESCLSVADKMEESINQSLQQAEALRQSILKKAFEGKLV